MNLAEDYVEQSATHEVVGVDGSGAVLTVPHEGYAWSDRDENGRARPRNCVRKLRGSEPPPQWLQQHSWGYGVGVYCFDSLSDEDAQSLVRRMQSQDEHQAQLVASQLSLVCKEGMENGADPDTRMMLGVMGNLDCVESSSGRSTLGQQTPCLVVWSGHVASSRELNEALRSAPDQPLERIASSTLYSQCEAAASKTRRWLACSFAALFWWHLYGDRSPPHVGLYTGASQTFMRYVGAHKDGDESVVVGCDVNSDSGAVVLHSPESGCTVVRPHRTDADNVLNQSRPIPASDGLKCDLDPESVKGLIDEWRRTSGNVYSPASSGDGGALAARSRRVAEGVGSGHRAGNNTGSDQPAPASASSDLPQRRDGATSTEKRDDEPPAFPSFPFPPPPPYEKSSAHPAQVAGDESDAAHDHNQYVDPYLCEKLYAPKSRFSTVPVSVFASPSVTVGFVRPFVFGKAPVKPVNRRILHCLPVERVSDMLYGLAPGSSEIHVNYNAQMLEQLIEEFKLCPTSLFGDERRLVRNSANAVVGLKLPVRFETHRVGASPSYVFVQCTATK